MGETRAFEPVVIRGGEIRYQYSAERARLDAVKHQFRLLAEAALPVLGFPLPCFDLMCAAFPMLVSHG